MPVFIRTSVLRVYGCVLSHTKTLVQILRPEGLSVIHKTLVIGNPKTSIPGKCDPPIRDYEGVEAQEKKHKKKKAASRKRRRQAKQGKQKQGKQTQGKQKHAKQKVNRTKRKKTRCLTRYNMCVFVLAQ